MDWRSNQWVGVGAAVLLVAAIVFLFYYTTGTPTTPGGVAPGEEVIMTFQCESTGEVFGLTSQDLENLETAETYMTGDVSEAKPCRICGAEDAHAVYYCKECDKWYRYTSAQGRSAGTLTCPEGHAVGKLMSPARVEEYRAQKAGGGGGGPESAE